MVRRVRTEVLEGPADGRSKRDSDPDRGLISLIGRAESRHLVSQQLDEIARDEEPAAVDVTLDLLATDGAVEVVIFGSGDKDVERVMPHPNVAVASDGWTMHRAEGGNPHSRSYGTFARVLQTYVRDKGILTLQEAVCRMTSLPVDRLGLTDRGRLHPGAVGGGASSQPGYGQRRGDIARSTPIRPRGRLRVGQRCPGRRQER